MTPLSSKSSMNELSWSAVGAWAGGTVVDVALSDGTGSLHGLLASRAGVYGWSQPGSMALPLSAGLNDLDVVSVCFAGGGAIAPAAAFAATATGRLFRSRMRADGMGHEAWEEVRSWAGLGVAVVLAPSPAFDDDQTLFVGTPTGIYRTQDNGESWESCNFGLLDEDVLCMVCAPNYAENEVLWAGTAGGGFYRSRNSGRAWRESGIGLADAPVQALAVSPNFAEDRMLFVGMEEHGIYLSRDGGENWTTLALSGQSVNSLACPQPDLLWAGTNDGLWRVDVVSGDAVQVTGAGEVVLSVAATAGGQVAIGLFDNGVWITSDGASAPHSLVWHKPDVALHAPPVVKANGGMLFGLDAEGFVARSDDGGAQWSLLESPSYNGLFALDTATQPTASGEGSFSLFATTGDGLARWNEAAQMWELARDESQTEHQALGVVLSPNFTRDKRLAVTTHDGELLLSRDGGASWQAITGPWRGQNILQAYFAPGDPDEMVVLTLLPNQSGHFDLSVWQTKDKGQHWEGLAGLSSGVPSVLLAWPQDAAERAIYLATQHRLIKLYYQSDPLTVHVHQHFFDESLRITSLAVAPDYDVSRTLWAATTGGLYRSVDRGLSWGLLASLPLELPVVWLEADANHVTAITLGGRVWRAPLSLT